MTNAMKSRTCKPAQKPIRRVSTSAPHDGCYTVRLTVGEGDKAQRFDYYVTPIPADFGMGFRVEKFTWVKGEESTYHVNIDARGNTCTCKGGTYSGHCKHVEAIAALLKAGRIQPAVKPQPEREPGVEDESKPSGCPCCGCSPEACDCWQDP